MIVYKEEYGGHKYSFKPSEIDIIDTLPYNELVGDVRTILGYVIKEKATYDEDGNELTPPVYSNNYKVDIKWHNEEQLPEWEKYEIKGITNVIHRYS